MRLSKTKVLSILVLALFIGSGVVANSSSDESVSKEIVFGDHGKDSNRGIIWEARINVTDGTFSGTSWVSICEAYPEGCDGPTGPGPSGDDPFDVPKAPVKPAPYNYMVLFDHLLYPCTVLHRDCRSYPDTYKCFNITITWNPGAYNFSRTQNITWNPSDLNQSEYDDIILTDDDGCGNPGIYLTNMKVNDSYQYNVTSPSYGTTCVTNKFHIICMKRINKMITTINENWNLVSLPFNVSVLKDDITVNYGGINYTWSDAVSNGWVSDFLFGWDRAVQYYTFSDVLIPGYGYWFYSYEDCELWTETTMMPSDKYISTIEPDWNLVGVPTDQPVNKTDILVNDEYWDTRMSNGWISDFVFGWNQEGQYYDFADTFVPGHAYWLYSYQQCVLKRDI